MSSNGELVPWLALAVSMISGIGALLAFLRSWQQDTDNKVDFDYYDARHEMLRRDIDASKESRRLEIDQALYRIEERLRILEIKDARRNGRPIDSNRS